MAEEGAQGALGAEERAKGAEESRVLVALTSTQAKVEVPTKVLDPKQSHSEREHTLAKKLVKR